MVLTTPDFGVDAGARLQLDRVPISLATGEPQVEPHLFDISGNAIMGRKAYANTDAIQVTIAPRRHDGTPSLRVQASLARIAGGGDNSVPPSEAEMQEALRVMQRELDDLGVRASIDEARLSRCDIFRTTTATHALPRYAPVLRLLEGRYARDRREYGDSGAFLWASTRREHCLYDKASEARAKGVEVPAHMDGLNVIRLESRWLKSGAIREGLPVGTASDLARSGMLDVLHEVYCRDVQNRVFRLTPGAADDVVLVQAGELAEQLLMCRESGSRNWVGEWVRLHGLRHLATIPLGVVREALALADTPRATVKAWMDRLRDVAMLQPVQGLTSTHAELYDELYHKLAA